MQNPQNAPLSTANSADSYFVHTGNFAIRFLDPMWESPDTERTQQFAGYTDLSELALRHHGFGRMDLYLCLRGKGRLELNNSIYAVERGTVWITSQTSSMYWHEYNKQETLILRLPFALASVPSICDTAHNRTLASFLQKRKDLIGRDEGLIAYDLSLCQYSSFLQRRMVSASSCGFESVLMALLMDSLYALQNTLTTQTDAEKITAYVKANVTQKISVGDLAKLLSVSERSLFYIFTKNFQTSPNDYINRTRMDAAAEHLAKGLTVREVSDLFKFSESTSFCRMFKKYYSMTPSEYQRKCFSASFSR